MRTCTQTHQECAGLYLSSPRSSSGSRGLVRLVTMPFPRQDCMPCFPCSLSPQPIMHTSSKGLPPTPNQTLLLPCLRSLSGTPWPAKENQNLGKMLVLPCLFSCPCLCPSPYIDVCVCVCLYACIYIPSSSTVDSPYAFFL